MFAAKPRHQRFEAGTPFTLCRHLHVYFARMRLLAVLKAAFDSWLDTERERLALWLYLLVALVVLPVLVPLAVLALEPSPARRRIMAGMVALGCLVALALVVTMVRGPIGAHIQGHHIAYDVYPSYGFHLTALYVLVTCGPMLTSSHRQIVRFGLINLLAVGVLAWLFISAFISLWCSWAAITSMAIDAHLRQSEAPKALISAFG